VQAFFTIRRHAHLIFEAHIVFHSLARHSDIVCDLIYAIPFRPTQQNAGASQPMDGGSFGILCIQFPVISSDLLSQPIVLDSLSESQETQGFDG